mmetsp:Transcript_11237/g.25780  ORF Transcript_11237/g.25780 Transcript_11237/m.25780 type:complete len:202 (+) Transcript_11237:99-704(+)|eukprot:CAMPEP_0178409614 /NCGR_PEP_ID=MMETSP0689_2-20121128/20553_1 /TAXON_ID=160604 /ORGANISM="Amphidinium massartii, Strain CS-259" /LENGTH=201 /DNA_ID=CAMNT_0020030761 /DNA_START=174 /DNA_END=779 /DNA_ORIENTATION=-
MARTGRLVLLAAAVVLARTLLPSNIAFTGARTPAAPRSFSRSGCGRVIAYISEGDKVPSVDVDVSKPGETVNVAELFKGKKGILFAVPGAFTPTCSEKHLPGYIDEADALKKAGAEVVACVAVNDPFVMSAWGKEQGTEGKVQMLADTKCELTKALDMELDATAKLGSVRSQRYAMIIEDGVVQKVFKDDDSFAPEVMKSL